MNKEEKIAEQKQKIEHYEGVLERYGNGRWYNSGKRHLEELKDELNSIENSLEE